MNCPHCQASQTRKLADTTDLGYAIFHCRQCKRKFNERTGSLFNYLEFPTDIVFQVVLCRLRYKLSLRDLAEMFFAARLRIHPRSSAGVGRALRTLPCQAPPLQT